MGLSVAKFDIIQYALNSSILSKNVIEMSKNLVLKSRNLETERKYISVVFLINYWVHRHFRSQTGVFSTRSLPRVHDAYTDRNFMT